MRNLVHLYLVVITVFLPLLVEAVDDDTCPGLPFCFCNKEVTSVSCNGKHLTNVPKIPESAEKLYLQYNDLSIVSTQIFSGLRNLQRLYLDHNKLSLIQPFAFEGLTNLTYLDLRNNHLRFLGNHSLSRIPALAELYLTTNKIQKVAENAFDGTSLLEYINFQSNDLATVPPLGEQPFLSQLILEGNDIIDATFPTSFKKCSQHTGIILSNNKIKRLKNSTFEALVGSSLTKLYLSRNGINSIESGAFASISFISSLKLGLNPLNSETLKSAVAGLAGKDVRSLDISGIALNGVLMEDTFSLLRNTTLNSLIMRFNKIKLLRDDTFSQLKSLTMLDLSNSEISDVEEQAFSGLDKLSTLNLNNNQLTSVPNNLPPSLHFLYLNDNQIARIQSGVFKHLLWLRDLRINDNNILTLESGAFDGLVNLEKLTLSNNDISILPGYIFSPLVKLTSLDLSGNKLYTIQAAKDRFVSLAALVFLNLADNQCSFFQKDLFKPMLSLKYLHLERNHLGNLFAEDYNGELFQDLKRLEELHIMNNEIELIQVPMLKNQLSLTVLNASHNKLSTWEPNFFKETQKLSTLDLSYNLIPTVKQEQINDLSNLRFLNLTGNPFSCNCDLRWFRDWINQTKTVLTNNASYTCNGPKDWAGKRLLDFSRNKINCLFFTKYAVIGAVCAAVVFALILVSLVYKNRWRLRLRWCRLSRRGRRFLRRAKARDRRRNYGAIENGHEIFDAYVSCSERDRPWALQNLLPGVDDGQLDAEVKFEGEFHLYYEDRDSEPGAPLVANVIEHMARSRKVIVVLSVNYFNGMNEFELDRATVLQHDHEIDDIIVVKLGNVPARRVPKSLYRQMRTGRFIEWEEDENAKETFRGKLIERLRKQPDFDDDL